MYDPHNKTKRPVINAAFIERSGCDEMSATISRVCGPLRIGFRRPAIAIEFDDIDAILPLNVVNSVVLGNAFGSQDRWPGQRIVLIVVDMMVRGKQRKGVRIKVPTVS